MTSCGEGAEGLSAVITVLLLPGRSLGGQTERESVTQEGDEGHPGWRGGGAEENSPQELQCRSCAGILMITRGGILRDNEGDELRDLGV